MTQGGLVLVCLVAAVTAIEDRLALADLAIWYEHRRAIVLDALVAIGRSAS